MAQQSVALFLDLSNDIQDETDWVVGQLKTIDLPLDISALAVDPISKLLAVGCSNGSIYLYGGPSVEAKLTTPTQAGVKFLSFATLAQDIVCIDQTNHLHIWDLTAYGGPEHLKSVRFDQVTSFHVSPSLQHVFVGLQSGEVKTYDLGCLRRSEYTVPNMWKLYQQKMKASGVPSVVPPSISQVCVDQQLHPRDLNLLFVAYSGGVILSNLTERSSVRAYEMTLAPGAPGGFGYGMDDILTHRRPEVTSLAIHPSGHFFAVGHADGSIAFWAVEDDREPLLVRTLDNEGVNLVDSEELEMQLERNQAGKGTFIIREPVFKISWSGFSNSSDPRGGETTLTILGGLDSRHGGSVSVLLLPAFQPPEPTLDPNLDPQVLHPFFREAMRKSLVPRNAYSYEGGGEVQDFLMCPQNSLHLGANQDPYAIVCIQTTADNSRIVQAYRFPPRGWIYPEETKVPVQQDTSATSESSPTSLSIPDVADLEEESQEMDLPTQLTYGSASITGGHLFTLQTSIYEGIIQANEAVHRNKLELEGGMAFTDQSMSGELRLAKHQPNRLLVTYDTRLIIRIFDMSAQLLSSPEGKPLKTYFPNPLFGFTVDLGFLTRPSALSHPENDGNISVDLVSFAPEAMELAIALTDGSVVICRPSTMDQSFVSEDEQIVVLNRPPQSTSALSACILVKGLSHVQYVAMSDIGFLAISYTNGTVVIVDMRGPRILLNSRSNSKRASSIGHRHSHLPDIATSLAWSITPIDKDPKMRLRLLVSRASGIVEIYTLAPTINQSTWSVAGEPTTAKGMPGSLKGGSFVLEGKTGTRRGANRSSFRDALSGSVAGVSSIFVAVGATGAKSQCNINGERLGKVEWSHRYGSAITAEVVERMASKALVIITDKNMALVYALPSLEAITTLKLLSPELMPSSIDESGDFITFISSKQGNRPDKIAYGTLFDIRRVRGPPEIDLLTKTNALPQPQPISMGPASLFGTWLNFSQTLSGVQVDELLGGANRPLVPKPGRTVNVSSNDSLASSASNTATGIASSAAAVQASIYGKLSSALSERGQLLDELGERFNSLESGSRNMVAQAKKIAAQQTAKSWFGF
ncbi:hypothetical protein FA15DRAFT_673956 [Coprinopsis marcescibilis]|uniref:Lethal giant larvae (Lgl)-like C-terminal domain-containing protein n=1 Tax=Coprinopsis marcescibilis TaxID=230819 RepID=A0A5C3KJF0_COPMA|nr:hypothetical protein FA15DRAFT_673956 [Coprinopsis marcescibilis]